jgi:hypothetical protein
VSDVVAADPTPTIEPPPGVRSGAGAVRALMWGLLAGLPLLVAIVAFRWRPWFPVLDMAMTEFRVRDVGTRRTPLIGLPGRIGNFPDQGSHPGPASFWLVAPFYRLGGSGAWGMQLGMVMVNVAALVGIVAVLFRRAGTRGAVVGLAIGAVLVRGYGISVLSHPWNPYFPLLIWVLVLLAAWSVACGDRMLAVVVVIGASICAQIHVPYLPLAVAAVVFTLAWLAVSAARSDAATRRLDLRALAWATGAGAVMWVPPLVDQIRRDPGNIRMLLDHFATPGEDPIGVGAGIRVFIRHVDAPAAFAGLLWRSDRFVELSSRPDGALVGGLLTLAVFALSIVFAWRRRLGSLLRLQAVVLLALAIGLLSMTRIFGKVWYYLTLWAWGTLTVLVLAVVWAAWEWWRTSDLSASFGSGRDMRVVPVGAAAVALVITALSIGAAAVAEVPEPMLSKGLGLVIDPTVDAVAAGDGAAVGTDGSYIVFWQDSVFIGAQGYGLVNELERRGLDVGVHPTWRVPVTHHRVMYPGDNDAEIHLVSGMFIEQWRARPGLVEVIEVDARSESQRRRFDELRSGVVSDLGAIGRDDLVPVLFENLFGASLDPDLPDPIRLDMSEMLLIGEPVAVFIAPAGTTQ